MPNLVVANEPLCAVIMLDGMETTRFMDISPERLGDPVFDSMVRPAPSKIGSAKIALG